MIYVMFGGFFILLSVNILGLVLKIILWLGLIDSTVSNIRVMYSKVVQYTQLVFQIIALYKLLS